MPTLIDIAGQRFGHLLVLSKVNRRGTQIFWLCRCDCGNEKSVNGQSLREAKSRSCGCQRRKDITGKRYGRLTAIEVSQYPMRIAKRQYTPTLWRFRCDCGNEIIARYGDVVNSHLTRSCGCLSREITIEHNHQMSGDKHPRPLLGKKGPLHPTWKGGQHSPGAIARNDIALQLIQWRMDIYTRDNFTCQICGAKGVQLNAHHVLAFRSNPSERLKLDNGLAVCIPCHRALHSKRRAG